MLWKVPPVKDAENLVVMEQVTDPVELAKARAQRERFNRNWDWYQAHVLEIGEAHRGKCICVAGQELFVADSAPQAISLAKRAHPDDDGFLMRYIPRKKMERIYAHSRSLDVV